MFNFFNKQSVAAHTAVTLKINGMHCVSCSMNIDGELEDTPGVIEADTNYAKGESKITFDPKKINQEKLAQVVKRLGYQVV